MTSSQSTSACAMRSINGRSLTQWLKESETSSWKPYLILVRLCPMVHTSSMESTSLRRKKGQTLHLRSLSRCVAFSMVWLVRLQARAKATERLPESRKLELNAYLTKPTTRLARYPLLLGAVLKQTPEDSPDKVVLPQVITMVREFLAKVNTESGKTENRFNLIQLDQQLLFKPGEEVVRALSKCFFSS